jgi:hypothetical protein
MRLAVGSEAPQQHGYAPAFSFKWTAQAFCSHCVLRLSLLHFIPLCNYIVFLGLYVSWQVLLEFQATKNLSFTKLELYFVCFCDVTFSSHSSVSKEHFLGPSMSVCLPVSLSRFSYCVDNLYDRGGGGGHCWNTFLGNNDLCDVA